MGSVGSRADSAPHQVRLEAMYTAMAAAVAPTTGVAMIVNEASDQVSFGERDPQLGILKRGLIACGTRKPQAHSTGLIRP